LCSRKPVLSIHILVLYFEVLGKMFTWIGDGVTTPAGVELHAPGVGKGAGVTTIVLGIVEVKRVLRVVGEGVKVGVGVRVGDRLGVGVGVEFDGPFGGAPVHSTQ
jgi:hypothetical protein